jgi:hypothetical protein
MTPRKQQPRIIPAVARLDRLDRLNQSLKLPRPLPRRQRRLATAWQQRKAGRR